MKKLLLASVVLFAVIAALSSCGEPKEESKLIVSPLTVGVNSSVATVMREITVSATSAWEVTASPDWIEINNITEAGFTIAVEPYVGGEEESRQGVIMVETGYRKQEVTVTQLVSSSLTATPYEIQIGSSTEVISREIAVTAAEAWEVTSKPEWISTSNITDTGFSIAVEPYIDGEEPSRMGVITIEAGEEECEISVTQLVYMIPVVLTVTPEQLPSALKDVEYEISVTASHAYEADTESEWITVSKKTDTGFVIMVAPYGELQDESRTGTVEVTMKNLKREITVTQLKPLPDATPITAYLGEYTVTGDSKSIGYGGGGTVAPYATTAEMVRRPDIGDNVISMKILGDDENPICFIYDPVTGVIKSYNYEVNPTLHRGCTFAFFTEAKINWTWTTTHIPVPD